MDARIFPQSLEAERALLGGLIEDPRQIDEVATLLRPEDFYRPEHRLLFSLLLRMNDEKQAIDPVTVTDRIGREGRSDQFGGVAYVATLPDEVPSTANLAHYALSVKDKARLRGFIESNESLVGEAYLQPHDVDDLLERASQQLSALARSAEKRTWAQLSEVLDDEVVRLQELSVGASDVTGIPTGFTLLDRKLAGMHRGQLLILAARPAMGKTALALNLAQNAAIDGKIAVGIFSLEMPTSELASRMLCCEARVDAGKAKTGQLDTEEWERFLEASEWLRAAPVHIDDTGGLSLTEVRGRARRLKANCPDLGLLVIDYLQLMRGDDARAPREQQISSISRGLKALAKELDVPIVALSQLNRGVEQRADKRPLPSDLRESGAIEQDADVILFIYRDEVYNPDTADKGLAEIIIAKQRSGPTGTVKLAFQGRFTRFDNYAEDEVALMP